MTEMNGMCSLYTQNPYLKCVNHTVQNLFFYLIPIRFDKSHTRYKKKRTLMYFAFICLLIVQHN